MEELRTEIQENSSKKDNVPVVVGSEYQDTKIQRMVHFFFLSDVKNEILDMRGKTSTSGVLRNQEGYSDRKSTRLNSSHVRTSRMPSSA